MTDRVLPYKPRLKREERRALIEQAASQLIAERGYDAASLDDIAAAAGISKAVLYDHYPSKAALQIALLEANSAALLAFTAERITSAEGPENRFRAGVEAFFEFVETHEFAWRMIFRDAPSDPEVAKLSATKRAEVTQWMAAMLRSEPVLGERLAAGDPERVEMLAEQIKMAMAGLAGWWYEHRDRPREDIVDATVDLVWVGLEQLAARLAAES